MFKFDIGQGVKIEEDEAKGNFVTGHVKDRGEDDGRLLYRVFVPSYQDSVVAVEDDLEAFDPVEDLNF